MSHIETRYVVKGRIQTDTSTLLDAIEDELPAVDVPVLGNEYDLERTQVRDSDGTEIGEEQIIGRMTFASDGTEFANDSEGNPKLVVDKGSATDSDGNRVPAANEVLRENVDEADIYGPETAAQQLFNQIVSHDLATEASNWRVWLYRSPEGGVTADAVREWYEEDESRQPEDENGEKYIPRLFDPTNHIIAEDSG